jgi:dCMP deaminase
MGGRLIPEDGYDEEYWDEFQWWDAVSEDPDGSGRFSDEDLKPHINMIRNLATKLAADTEFYRMPSIPLRPNWDEYFMEGARWAASKSDCERDKVGAVIVDKHNRVRITGYNGAPKGDPGCDTCPRRTSGCAPGSSYDTDIGRCVAVHAEANALLWAKEDLTDATMYVTREPCYACSKLIAGAGIRRVVWPGGQMERDSE